MPNWTITTTEGDANEFHSRTTDHVDRPTIWVHKISRPALVLGSTQQDSILDEERATQDNIEVCKRRSGGGLVRIEPDELWVDVLLPKGSELWKPDIAISMVWVGQTWASAIKELLPTTTPTVYSGPLLNRHVGKILCFGGMGSGEVEVDRYKVVGISQRRTRHLARFQCLVKPRWRPESVLPYLTPAPAEEIPWHELRIGFPPHLHISNFDDVSLLKSFVKHLPTP